MTVNAQPLLPTIVPESAPFSEEQRAWLNGFFAGLVSLDQVTALSPDQAKGLLPEAPKGPLDDGDDGEAPWHDQTMTIAERMQLAAPRPLRRKLMAAMAQQDCGQCGYNCEDYSNALFLKQEERLNLCVPGGKETNRMLKKLFEEFAGEVPAAAAPSAEVPAKEAPLVAPGRSRDNPVIAKLTARYLLNGKDSEKRTHHIEFDLSGTGLDYVAGDSFGIFPENHPGLVDAVIAMIGARPDAKVGAKTLREVLCKDVSLSPAPDSLFQLISLLVGGDRRRKAKALAAGEDPDGDAATLDVLAALKKFETIRPDPEVFVEALEPLQPRLYSISSSPKAEENKISLTVDLVRYVIGSRERRGVASDFLANGIATGGALKVYVQRAHNFGLPENSQTPIIMVGPGTGVAPFRAFLQERMATKAEGRNWLFFGHQRSDCDFFYKDELSGMQAAGLLTRLTLAWSRDGDQKIYVQDRMREEGKELFSWLEAGAHFYVCGDAKRMAKDVERAMTEIVAQHGNRSPEDAVSYVNTLKRAGRYQADVY
ncbi:MAG TPA: sulfite reductase subunit alpha [Xanthobacteraceae bacterium]|nr:sulfite reductase subunit alpha [Xanthobacteraceae bacterium]